MKSSSFGQAFSKRNKSGNFLTLLLKKRKGIDRDGTLKRRGKAYSPSPSCSATVNLEGYLSHRAAMLYTTEGRNCQNEKSPSSRKGERAVQSVSTTLWGRGNPNTLL